MRRCFHSFIYFFTRGPDLHQSCLSNLQPSGHDKLSEALVLILTSLEGKKKKATWVSGATDAFEAATCVDTDPLVQARWVLTLIHVQVTQCPKIPRGADAPEPEEGMTTVDQKEATVWKNQTMMRLKSIKNSQSDSTELIMQCLCVT